MVQAKVSSHLGIAQGHRAWAIKQSEMAVMAAAYVGLGDLWQSQSVNLDWLVLMSGLGLTEASCFLFERI